MAITGQGGEARNVDRDGQRHKPDAVAGSANIASAASPGHQRELCPDQRRSGDVQGSRHGQLL